MRLALNATSLLSPLTGIGHYTRQLALGLASRPEVNLHLFLGSGWQQEVPQAASASANQGRMAALRKLPGAYELRRLLQVNRFAAGVRSRAINLYHEPNILPLPFRGPTVVTVHDLSWIRHPEAHPENRVRAMNRYFEAGLRQATMVLTDSEFIRQEILGTFAVPADRVRAIHLGCESAFAPRTAADTAAVLRKYSLQHGNYLLTVGTLEPRKNLITALKAYKSLPAPLRSRFPLVVIGMKGWKSTTLEADLSPLVQSGEVRQLGYVNREDLAILTAGASAMVYPSIYEGFGLPPLEAMACGVPTITSNTTSLPEVVGAGALQMAPHDHETLATHMQQLLSEPELRAQLGRYALERSGSFSWARCVDETLAAYRAAAAMSLR